MINEKYFFKIISVFLSTFLFYRSFCIYRKFKISPILAFTVSPNTPCIQMRRAPFFYWNVSKIYLKLNVVDKSIFLLEKSLISFKYRKMLNVNSYNQYSDIEHSVSDFSDLHFERHLHVHVNVYNKGYSLPR